MHYLRCLSAGVFLMLSQVCFAQNFRQLPDGQKLAGSQFYILPKAGFQVELYTIQKDIKPGHLLKMDYSDAELKVLSKKYGVDPQVYKKLKDGAYTSHEIAEDSIKLSQVRLPDLTKVFYNTPKKKWNATQVGALSYSEDGMLTDAESNYESRTFDIAIKSLAGLASIVSGFRGVDGFKEDRVTIKELDDILSTYAKLDAQNNFDVYKDLKATLEKQYTKAFADYFYAAKSKTKPAKLIYSPSLNMAYNAAQSIDLFALDNNGKLLYNKDLAGDIVWAMNCKAATSPLNQPYKIQFNLLAQTNQPMELHDGSSVPADSYLGYNVPAKSKISIVKPDGEEVGQDVFKVPQFGKMAYISARKMHVIFQLDPMTGELKKLSVSRKAISDDQVGNTATAINSAIQAVKGEDADTRLDKEVKRLENEKKKRDLLKEFEE